MPRPTARFSDGLLMAVMPHPVLTQPHPRARGGRRGGAVDARLLPLVHRVPAHPAGHGSRGPATRSELLAEWGRIALLGFLGMWICGALVYLALRYTTATNATLIYTTSSVMILLLDWALRDRSA